MTAKGTSGSPFHRHDADGSGPPAEKGPNAADVSAKAAILRMVEDGRARRVSWANLSKMTGKSEAYLRRLGVD